MQSWCGREHPGSYKPESHFLKFRHLYARRDDNNEFKTMNPSYMFLWYEKILDTQPIDDLCKKLYT